MWTVMYNHRGEWIHTDTLVTSIPPILIGSTVDFEDIHYEVANIVIQPVQKRYKVFLERI